MSLSAIILAAAIAGSAPQASSADADLSRATISFADLDLSTGSGQKRLRTRLASAIRQMCSVQGPPHARAGSDRRACLRTAKGNGDAAFAQAVANARHTEMAAR